MTEDYIRYSERSMIIQQIIGKITSTGEKYHDELALKNLSLAEETVLIILEDLFDNVAYNSEEGSVQLIRDKSISILEYIEEEISDILKEVNHGK